LILIKASPSQRYGGIDPHTSVMSGCITDAAGTILVHKNLPERISPSRWSVCSWEGEKRPD